MSGCSALPFGPSMQHVFGDSNLCLPGCPWARSPACHRGEARGKPGCFLPTGLLGEEIVTLSQARGTSVLEEAEGWQLWGGVASPPWPATEAQCLGPAHFEGPRQLLYFLLKSEEHGGWNLAWFILVMHQYSQRCKGPMQAKALGPSLGMSRPWRRLAVELGEVLTWAPEGSWGSCRPSQPQGAEKALAFRNKAACRREGWCPRPGAGHACPIR